MRAHAELFRETSAKVKPEQRLLEKALAIAEKAYAITKYSLPDDMFSKDAFRRAIARLDNTSSPGYPYSQRGPTIGDVLGFNGLYYDDFRVESLWHDVTQLMSGDFSEVIYTVFVKDEPHKMTKVESNMWRLIIASPLNVQVLWHMCFAEMNDLVIDYAYELPSQQGIVLNAGGWRRYMASWISKGYNVGLDKRAWDWTVPGWKLDLALEFRRRMVFGSNKEAWDNIATALYKSMFVECNLMLSSGYVYRQLVPGIMKSGCVNTISDNSVMQVLDHVLACLMTGTEVEPLPKACGDDTLQCDWQVSNLAPYEQLGSIVKSVTSGLEFVGTRFTSEGPQPLYFEKHVYKLPYLKKEVLPDYLSEMCRMYAYSPRYDFWETLAVKLGYGNAVFSRGFYLAWYEYGLD